MSASIHPASGLQRDLVVVIGAGLKTLPCHDGHFDDGNDAGVLNDKKTAPAGTHIRSDIAAFEQFLPTYAFDKKLRCIAGVYKLERRLQYAGAHESALHVPDEQRWRVYIGSAYCDTGIFLKSAGDRVAHAEYNRGQTTTCSSKAVLSAPITIHASALTYPAKQISANKISKPINPGILNLPAPVAPLNKGNARQRSRISGNADALRRIGVCRSAGPQISFPLRRRSLPALTAQLAAAGTQYVSGCRTSSPRRGGTAAIQFQTQSL